ncbi:M1 family metallopeptidase [Aurantiacibacter sp. D1-12]|uniref:M1 family metallopeptidase n=1 Tax=Aurantiacibacter sp. D1-12 TaxID=2993658 RepID=UPI00237CF8EA|nr:M1 family metallopeptidase [Aurantiacibacter sp. D1-12]MDE1468158.1 M1 family metallopeptidase [Aurantiacibacter sp. D1-12]
MKAHLLLLPLTALVLTPASADAQSLSQRTAQTDLPLTGPRAAMQIEHVDLAIAVLPDRRRIEGDSSYRLTASEALDELALDLDPRYNVTAVSIDGVELAADAYANPRGILTMRLPSAATAGDTINLRIQYEGSPHVARNAPWDGGIVWSQSNGQPWIATAFQGEGCDMLWPCIDNSAHRLGSIDTMWTVPTGLTATGNGRLVSEVDNGDGTTTFHWTARDPSNYGIVLQIGPYELSEQMYESRFGNTIPIQFWHLPESRKEARALVREMATYLDFFESTIGPYPFGDEKAGIVETPHLGMEHQTINAYGNRFRPDPLGYDWLLQHEFAHEWFANQLTHASINHMWLHEGIGTWMQPLYLGWMHGEMYYTSEMWRQRRGIRSQVPLVSPEGELPDYNDEAAGWGSDIYAKGAWVMHTMRYLVGEEALFPALTQLTYGTTSPVPGEIRPVSRTTDDFRVILGEMTGEDLNWFFDAYFYQADLPRLNVEQSGRTVAFEWVTPSEYAFEMPLEVRVNGSNRTLMMTGGRGEIELPDENAHFLPDPDNQILMYDEAIARWQESR